MPSIKYLIICGKDSEGHYSGNTLVSLVKNGADPNMRVIESKGKKPILLNMTKEEVNAFRNQIEIIDMIECEDIDKVLEVVGQLSRKTKSKFSQNVSSNLNFVNIKPIVSSIETIETKEKDPNSVKLDKAGYFVIVPKVESNIILVEHYNYANQLLRLIKGKDSRNIYWTIIENGWVTELSHAAYLGKELSKAGLSIKYGFKYVQDKA